MSTLFGFAFAEGLLVSRGARSTDPRACARVDPKIRTRQRMSALAVCLGGEGHIFGVADNDEVIRIPAGMDATQMMQLQAIGNWASQPFPAQPMGRPFQTLAETTVRIRWPGEQPAGSQRRMGLSKDGAVE